MKLSFIVPVYNVEKYLRKCLDSLINQTFPNIEIIAVNDGSTDQSPLILREYAKKDKRIKIINQQNSGLSAARNTGLQYATGDYVFFVDSDDYVVLDAAEIINCSIKSIEVPDVPEIIFFSRFHLKNGILQKVNISSDQRMPINGLETLTDKLEQRKLVASVSAKVFRLDFLRQNNIQFIQGIRYEDMYFTIKTISCARKTISIDQYLYVYRLDNDASITNTIRPGDTDVLITLNKVADIVKSRFCEFEESSLWRSRMCAWICNATFFKYPIKNFWSRTGWANCRTIKSDPLFAEYLEVASNSASNPNFKLALVLIKFNLALFYIARYVSKKIFPKKEF